MDIERQVIAYKNYFLDFYSELDDNVQAKIEWTLNLIQITQQVPEKYFKHLTGTKGLYEVQSPLNFCLYIVVQLTVKVEKVVFVDRKSVV